MDGRGMGSCTILGSSPLGLSFSISPSVRLSDVGRGEAGKGGSWVLTPDLIVMTKVGASDSGVSLSLIVKRIWDNWPSSPFFVTFAVPQWWGIVVLIKPQKGRIVVDVSPGQAYLLGQIVCIEYSLIGISTIFFGEVELHAELSELIEFPTVILRYVVMKDLYQKPFLGLNFLGTSHAAAFPLREKWKKRILDMSLESRILPVCSVGRVIGFWKPEGLGENVHVGFWEVLVVWLQCCWRRMLQHKMFLRTYSKRFVSTDDYNAALL
ncbi:hypothetical protein Tco_0451777 [Tanacetum coccineum]